jgi:carbonic anhydrase/acetyltransferase-like protein (isoleucine patch superfamily)
MVVPDQSLVMGAPAKIIRSLRPEEIAKMADGAQGYQARAVRYRRELQEVKG